MTGKFNNKNSKNRNYCKKKQQKNERIQRKITFDVHQKKFKNGKKL